MKQLFDLLGQAALQNGGKSNTWFIDFHGHVYKLSIKYYPTGWGPKKEPVKFDDYISNQEGIKAAIDFLNKYL